LERFSKMKDINGAELRTGDTASLLCEILDITEHGVAVRVLNSTQDLLVGCKHDEVLGGLVADSELTLFERLPVPASPEPEAVEITAWPME
jgi:hypothetical protein